MAVVNLVSNPQQRPPRVSLCDLDADHRAPRAGTHHREEHGLVRRGRNHQAVRAGHDGGAGEALEVLPIMNMGQVAIIEGIVAEGEAEGTITRADYSTTFGAASTMAYSLAALCRRSMTIFRSASVSAPPRAPLCPMMNAAKLFSGPPAASQAA